DVDELAGIVPISAFLRLIGLRIVNARRVWAGGTFAFERPVTVRRGALQVTRSASGTRVVFPSGKVVEADAAWQLIEDDTPATSADADIPPTEPEAQQDAPAPT
ncbi:MAG: hypothetical protein CUN49_18695, partial [Candidatus Thermofonsia Clade 1 bacterium]